MGCCQQKQPAQQISRNGANGVPQQQLNASDRNRQQAQSNSRRPADNTGSSSRTQAQGQRSNQQRGGQRQGHAQNSTGLRITYLQNPQVEIIKHDKTIGEGVQKTLCYDTPYTVEELEKWRQEFWETRTTGSQQVWQLLKNACEADKDDAMALVQAAQLQLPQESLTTAIDQAGVYYRVPICCIQPPDNYQVDHTMDAMKAKKAPAEKNITIKVRNTVLGDKNVVLANTSTIETFKNLYIEACDQELVASKEASAAKLRFFCGGKELKNDLFLYSYDIGDKIVVQAMLRQ